MSTTYPGTVKTFTDPAGTSLLTSPDHAGLHTDMNDTVEAIQNTIGTTAGTNVLKNFAAGEFPARVNSGGTIVQTLTGGTINNSTFGTPTVVVGSDAQGDVFFRASSGILARLAPGTSGHFLKTQGAAADPVWAAASSVLSSKIITSTRDMTAASGDVAYTGVGFVPTAVIGLMAITGNAGISIGFSDSSLAESEVDLLTGAAWTLRARFLSFQSSGGNEQAAVMKTYDADGFTLTWTKTSAPAGTADLAFLCLR